MQMSKVRRKARKCALQILYSAEMGGASVDDVVAGKSCVPDVDEIDDYAVELLNGIPVHAAEIDRMIDSVSKNWTVQRMPIVDKLLLRQAVYEMKYLDDVPISVSINEAVELAKKFGGDEESHKFINGILGKIATDLEENNG